MTTLFDTTAVASVFVTSYALGNEYGFATGKWFDLLDYADKEQFLEAATSYIGTLGDHSPELCFPDFECNFKSLELIDESYISENVWQVFALEDYEFDVLVAYTDCLGVWYDFDELLEKAQNNLVGEYESDIDYAEQYLEDTGVIDSDDHHSFLMDYIDMEALARYLTQGLYESNGYYFTNQ